MHAFASFACPQNVTRLCGADADTLSCAMYTNIYGRTVARPFAVHPLATGIRTTNQAATRDWLMGNILKATDEYSTALSTNMTTLTRQNFAIDDRVNKAWFVSPGNRWNIPMTNGYQSDLLLSDKLIMISMITLNDGDGNVLRRRLLSFSSSLSSTSTEVRMQLVHDDDDDDDDHAKNEDGYAGRRSRSLLSSSPAPPGYVSVPVKAVRNEADDSMVTEALKSIMLQEPRAGTLPTIQYNIDVPETMTRIFGVEGSPFVVLEFLLYARYDEKKDQYDAMEQIGREFQRRLQANKDIYCKTCDKVVPVFNNLQTFGEGVVEGGAGIINRRRNLLAAGADNSTSKFFGYGSYSVMLVYNKDLFSSDEPILLSDIQSAVYSPDFSVAFNGSIHSSEFSKYIEDLENQHFIINDLTTKPTNAAKQAK